MWVNWSPVIEAAVVAPLLGLPGATRGHDRGKVRKGWASPLWLRGKEFLRVLHRAALDPSLVVFTVSFQ